MSAANGVTTAERFRAQRRAAGIDPDPMWWVFVLELKADSDGVTRYYVGHTSRLQRRIHDHMNSSTSAWVKRWGVQSVMRCIRTTEDDALGLEIGICTELKAKKGWQYVRGGVDNNPRDSPVPHYWEAPARGMCPDRQRSRSPTANIPYEENNGQC